MKGQMYKTFGGHTLNKILVIAALAFLMLVSIAGASPFAYITNEESKAISVIDTDTNKVIATISVGSNPEGVGINPDGTKVYVANSLSNDVSVINTATNTVTATVSVGSSPKGVAVSPDGKKVYVTNLASNTVSIIDTTSNTVISTVKTGKSPTGVAVSPDGKEIYVTNNGDRTVSIINTDKKAVISTVSVGKSPEEIAITPDGSKVYVANSESSSISVIDTATNSVTSTVTLGEAPYGIAINPDGTKAYVSNNGKYFSTVSVIDISTNKVTATIPVGSNPAGIAVTPDGKKVYVVINSCNTVSVIDAATNTVTSTMLVGKSPYALFIGSIPVHPAYPSANFNTNSTEDYVFLSEPVQFKDLSENTSKWKWDFGDGTSSTKQNPTHSYSAPGVYTVSLTASNSNGTDTKQITVSAVQKGVLSPSYAFITNINSNTVSVFNTENNNLTATVPVGINPIGVAVSQDAKKVYVTNANYDRRGTVSVIDTATNKVTASIDIGDKYSPYGIAVTPDGKKLYVADRDINGITVIDTATNTITATIPAGKGPMGVVALPDGTKVYVTNSYGNTVSVIDPVTNAIIATVNVELGPSGITVSPDGTKVYVTNSESNTVSVIDTSTNTVVATVPVEEWPMGVAVSPDGTKVYVADERSNNVSVIDTVTKTIIAAVKVRESPYGIAVTPDGTKVYVVNNGDEEDLGNTVSIIDTASNKVITTEKTGYSPVAFGQFISPLPAQPLLPVANFSSNITFAYAPVSVQFTDFSKNMDGWNWDFGDGTSSTKQNPTHTYSRAGNFNVKLTVNNKNGTASRLVTVTVLAEPEFIAYPISGKTPLSVSFTDQSTGSPASWEWDFGDGTYSTKNNPIHIYKESGKYAVALTLNETGNKTAVTKYKYIIVSNGDETPVAAFSASSSIGKAPLTTSFTDKSTGSPTAWKWNFGDGTYSTAENPEHTYEKAGSYPVTLTVSNEKGSNTLTKSGYIKVSNLLDGPVPSFSASKTSGTAPLTVDFTGQAKGSLTTWKWSFGDGNTSTDKNPVYTFNESGLYSIRLTASNEKGSNTLVKKGYIAVSDVSKTPVSSFSASINSGKVPLTVSFTDQSTGSPTAWKWYFGDGSNSTERNPVHTYNESGMYYVSLIVSNSDGSNSLTKTGYIAVSGVSNPPVTSFSASQTSEKTPFTIQFTDQSTGSPEAWKWVFGDGNDSRDENTVYTYSKSGNYTVALTTTNEEGSNRIERSNYISINSENGTVILNSDKIIPVTAFSAPQTTGSMSLTMSFTDQSTGSPTAWKWYFGDGSNSTERNPVHTYNEPGKYTVTLTTSNANGSNTLTKTSYILITGILETPVSKFSASSTSGSMPLKVRFTDQSTGSPTEWRWYFGDGSDASKEKNPVHTYNESGRYTVTLTASNENGSNTLTKSGYIVVSNVLNGPVTYFSASSTSGKAPFKVSFTDQSTGSPTEWEWAFGDGSDHSTEKNPVHTYNESGLYSVTLTTSNANGGNELTRTAYISVSGVSITPLANFSASPASGSVPLTVNFTDQSTGSPTSWRWYFGDGNNSIERNPVHTYNESGLYTVTLIASNENGSNTLTRTGYVAVSNSLVASFSASPTSGSFPLSVNFRDNSTGSPEAWLWEFGDGNKSTERNPVHIYDKPGKYTVSLTINNTESISYETRFRYITVNK